MLAALEKSARLGPEAALLLRSELGLVNLKRGVATGIKEQIAADKVQTALTNQVLYAPFT